VNRREFVGARFPRHPETLTQNRGSSVRSGMGVNMIADRWMARARARKARPYGDHRFIRSG
jgi:hypothetical protein